MATRTEPAGARRSPLREFFAIERPPPQPAVVRRLRVLVAVCAAATVLVESVNLQFADEAGFALTVRTAWALLRAVGFLVLMRSIRYARLASRPFGLILCVTTVFAVGRLVVPRTGALLPDPPVLVGFGVLAMLCTAVVWQLYASPAIAAHLTRRPPRRPVTAWVLTSRVAGLSYGALLLVPALVAVGSLATDRRVELAIGVPVVVAWIAGTLVLGFVMPWLTIFLVFGKRWVRALLAVISAVVLVAGPLLCLWFLGVDGLIRDGAPLAIAATLCLYGLWASRSTS